MRSSAERDICATARYCTIENNAKFLVSICEPITQAPHLRRGPADAPKDQCTRNQQVGSGNVFSQTSYEAPNRQKGPPKIDCGHRRFEKTPSCVDGTGRTDPRNYLI